MQKMHDGVFDVVLPTSLNSKLYRNKNCLYMIKDNQAYIIDSFGSGITLSEISADYVRKHMTPLGTIEDMLIKMSSTCIRIYKKELEDG